MSDKYTDEEVEALIVALAKLGDTLSNYDEKRLIPVLRERDALKKELEVANRVIQYINTVCEEEGSYHP